MLRIATLAGLLLGGGVGLPAPAAAQEADLRELRAPAPLAVPQPIPLPAPLAAGGVGANADGIMPEVVDRLPAGVSNVSEPGGGFEVGVDRSRILTLEKPLPESAYESLSPSPQSAVAAGDERVLSVEVIDAHRVRLYGRRMGVTDLSIVAKDGTVTSMEVAVTADLDLLQARVRAMFPDADVRFGQVRDHIVVEGQVRDSRQAAQVVQAVNAYLLSLDAGGPPGPGEPAEIVIRRTAAAAAGEPPALPAFAQLGEQAEITPPRVINLLRVPGPQQVLLKVQVAELNRTALRELGISFLAQTDGGGFGSNVSGDLPFNSGGSSAGTTGSGGSAGSSAGGGVSASMSADPLSVTNLLTAGTPLFGVFGGGDFSIFLSALRRNDLFRVLAEPNLVALQGQEASFLAGGEFPIPVPQASSGVGSVITVAYREFGVGLTFIPFLIDGDTVRLSVAPEVSSLDFAQGITLQGFRVPALNKRRTSTVVQLQHGQTLAISGLLQLEITGTTGRIPGLGDLPYIGAFFRNNSMRRTEKELVILVTPYLVEPMDPCQVPPRPGDLTHEPDDFEFYALGHLEALYQQGQYRSTAAWADALGVERAMELDDLYLNAAHGFSACPPPPGESR
ncbi:type II and III secretion system protein family protein [Alienimonas sp. DA493]|uniref:type II and III secretion system protein family protein n=1 Tax=Alienimonas sp. DA493 TaxID=3373605 RepID=UPI00375430E5